MDKTTILSLLIIAGLIIAGCETTKGVGKDMEKAGQDIQKAADNSMQ